VETRGLSAVLSFVLLAAVAAPRSAHAVDDEVHWTMTGPTSVTVDWRGASTTVRYGPTSNYTLSATAVTPSPLPFSSAGPFREARIGGLLPGVTYHYAIGTNADHTFHTLPPATASFVVYAEGDVGDVSSYSRVGPVQALIAGGKPSFTLVVGDLTYGNANGLAVVDKHFNDVMVWSQDAAYMPGWGNHEWDIPTADDFRDYKGRFDFPNPQTSPGAPAAGCCGEDWYWFDQGAVRFIIYPEPYTKETWPDWARRAEPLFAAAQADPALRFIVTAGHRPAYSSGQHDGKSQIRAILDDFGGRFGKYVLNLAGHSHNYERTKPQGHVVHVTAGIGGGDLAPAATACKFPDCKVPAWVAFRAVHHGFVKLTVRADGIALEAICAGASPAEDSVRCGDAEILDQALIEPGR